MSPAARAAAAIDILGAYLNGTPIEQALTRWARASRFAGSKDRAAVRDLCFDALRRRRSLGALDGDGATPRLWLARLLQQNGMTVAEVFTGTGHAPAMLSPEEHATLSMPLPHVPDIPPWLEGTFCAQLGDAAAATFAALQTRAPITLRVNTRKATRDEVLHTLRAAQIAGVANPLCDTALTVTDGARRLRHLPSYAEGYFEFQDAASQAVAGVIPCGGRMLDYCAGGGGKALAVAARCSGRIDAFDANPNRMSDLKARCLRAGVQVHALSPKALARQPPYDVVYCDVPCSGSGTWRRTPEAAWAFTPHKLARFVDMQREIITRAVSHVKEGGTFVYITCSILPQENEQQVEWMQQTYPKFQMNHCTRYTPTALADGAFAARFVYKKAPTS